MKNLSLENLSLPREPKIFRTCLTKPEKDNLLIVKANTKKINFSYLNINFKIIIHLDHQK